MAQNEVKPIALHGHMKPVTQIRYNREGDLIFSSGKDGIISCWRTTTGERIGTYGGHSAIAGIAVNCSTTLLASAGFDTKTNIYHAETGKIVGNIDHMAPCRAVGFSYDDRILFCVTDKKMRQEGKIHFFNLQDHLSRGVEATVKLNPFSEFKMPGGDVISYAEFGPTQETIYFGMENGTVGIIDVEKQALIRSARPHKEGEEVVRLHFDSNFYTVITASKDCTAKLLDPRTLQTIQTYQSDYPVNDASVSPISDHVIIGGGIDAQEAARTATGGFSIRFHHKIYENELGSTNCHFGTVTGMQFHPTGMQFASCAADGFVKLYPFGEGYKSSVGSVPLWPNDDAEEEEEEEEEEEAAAEEGQEEGEEVEGEVLEGEEEAAVEEAAENDDA